MRRLVMAGLAVLALAAVVAPAASAKSGSPFTGATSSKLTLSTKITSFRATRGGVVAKGVLTGRLRSGTSISHASGPVNFAVVAKSSGARCDVITLRLAPLNLELLGVQVTTSDISLDVYGLKGRVLGDLFCGLAQPRSRFRAPRASPAL